MPIYSDRNGSHSARTEYLAEKRQFHVGETDRRGNSIETVYDLDGYRLDVKRNGVRVQQREWDGDYQSRVICCIPDDYIDTKRYPLFVARAVMAELVAQLKASGKGAT